MQGESPDVVLQRIIECKGEMRKNMLNGYMKALDESEGLQQTIARLADRMGVGETPVADSTYCRLLTCNTSACHASSCHVAWHRQLCKPPSICPRVHCTAFSKAGMGSLQAASAHHTEDLP